MKQLIFIAGLFMIAVTTQGQKWQHTYGYQGTSEDSRELIEHYDHGYIVTSCQSSGSQGHGWIVKTDINGNKLWDIQIGINPDIVIPAKTLFDEEGNIYIFGLLKQPDLPHEYPLIVKLNACGEKQWCKLLVGGSNIEYGYFTDAVFLENGDLLGLASYPDSEQFDMIYLFCMSPEGEYRWRRSYASCSNHPYFAMRLGISLSKFSDMYIISGYVYSPYPGGDPYHAWLRPMFIGINENFDEQWVVEFGISDSLLGKAYRTIQINDSLFMGVGTNRWIDNGIITDNSFLMFYDKYGSETGHKIIYGSDIAQGIHQNLIDDIERIDQTRFICASCLGEEYQGSSSGELIIDTTGKVYNYAIRENTGGGASLIKSFDDKYVFAGSYRTSSQQNWDINLYKINENLEQDTLYPGNYTYDSLCGHTIESGVIDLGGCDVITGIGEIPTLEAYNQKLQTIPVTASPNPSNTGEILLEFENTGLFDNLELKVFDVFGKQVHTGKILPHQGAARLNVSNWASGMYVATVFSNGQIKGKCKVVVE